MFYIGLFILISASAQLVFVILHYFQRARSLQESIDLQQKILEAQVETAIAATRHGSLGRSTELAWPGWRKFRLVDIVDENSSIKSFYLLAHDGKPLPAYLPGQHLTFRFKVPGLSKVVIRCYSLSDSSDKRCYRISVKKQSAPARFPDALDGVASTYLHDVLEIGDVLDVKAPSGKFYLDQTERTPVVMIGGGIGITPSLSMLNALAAAQSTRSIFLLYAMQDLGDEIMRAELDSLCQQLPELSVYRFYAKHPVDALSEYERLGYIDVAAMQSANIPWDADFYVCGPPPMMQAVVGGLEKQGVDASRIHFESFGPASVSKRQIVTPENASNGESYLVNFTMSDAQVQWTQAHGSILDAAESIGVNIESGCRAGSCGTCLTAISEGQVTYIDEPGMEIEKGSCLACIAIPAGNLKLNA